MTALCGGGSSSPKTGSTDQVYGGAALAAYYAAKGVPYLSEVALLLGLLPLALTTLCATDPPTMPVWTKADSDAILQLQFGNAFNVAFQKARDILYNFVWRDQCKCDNATVPAAAVPPAPPVNLTHVNIAGSVACAETDITIASVTALSGTDFTLSTPAPGMLPDDGTYVTYAGGGTIYPRGIPAGITAGLVTQYPYTQAGGCPGIFVNFAAISFFNAAGAFLNHNYLSVPDASSPTSEWQTVPIPAGARYWYAWAQWGPNTCTGSGFPLRIQTSWFCGGASGKGPAGPCCSDPATIALLVKLNAAVNLMQRQLAPFAYIAGAAHAGLTLQGSFAVSSLLGLRIQLTTIPANLRQQADTPPYVFSAGWVSISCPDGNIDETRAHAANQVWQSRLMGEATLVGYSFSPGVVATITELQREPGF